MTLDLRSTTTHLLTTGLLLVSSGLITILTSGNKRGFLLLPRDLEPSKSTTTRKAQEATTSDLRWVTVLLLLLTSKMILTDRQEGDMARLVLHPEAILEESKKDLSSSQTDQASTRAIDHSEWTDSETSLFSSLVLVQGEGETSVASQRHRDEPKLKKWWSVVTEAPE